MVAVGTWQHFLGGDEMEDVGECDTAPLKSLTDPLPPILPLMIQFSAAPPSPTAALPPLVNLHILTNPNPEKEKNGVCHEGQT